MHSPSRWNSGLAPDKPFATVIILIVLLTASDEIIRFQVCAVTHPIQSWEPDLQRFSRLRSQGAHRGVPAQARGLLSWPGAGSDRFLKGGEQIVLLSPRAFLPPKAWPELIKNCSTFFL